ncbi:MAG: glycerophosphodiester phosphodiesterase [Bacteroidales bacterium]|nr:glycerophosphodiester phosphodiesterase [Bacteroidales bacterium]
MDAVNKISSKYGRKTGGMLSSGMRSVCLSVLILAGAAAFAQPKVVGHRGCRFNTPDSPDTPLYENTLNALKFAQDLKIDAVEFDVQLTSDGKIIVFHGANVPGIDKDIRKITFDEARRTVLPGGHRMPTIEEYLKQARKCPAVKIICEIKKQSTPERETMAVEQVMEAVRRMKMEDQVEYTSFSEWICSEIHRIDPRAKVIFLDSGVFVKTPEYAHEKGYNGISYNFDGFMNHPDYVERARKLGIETTLWIVNSYEVVEWAVRHGVDCVSSDHPELIKGYVDAISAFGIPGQQDLPAAGCR